MSKNKKKTAAPAPGPVGDSNHVGLWNDLLDFQSRIFDARRKIKALATFFECVETSESADDVAKEFSGGAGLILSEVATELDSATEELFDKVKQRRARTEEAK